MVANGEVRGHAGSLESATEEGFRTGAVPLVPQQKIYDLAVLIDGAREVAFLFAAEAEHFIHVPPPSPPSPVTRDCLGQRRAEGLYQIEPSAR